MSTARAPRRLRGGVAAAAAVLVGAGVAVAVWQPGQSVTSLPSHACWGALTADDLRPLAGKGGGTMTAETNTDTLRPMTDSAEIDYRCSFSWKDGQRTQSLNDPTIELYTASGLRDEQARDASAGKVQSLSFGAGNIAWQAATNVHWLNLAIPCTFQDRADGQVYNGYARVWLDMATNLSGVPVPSSDVRQADAGIVLKLAKAFAQQYPCSGVTLPADAPSIPAFPGS